MGNDSVASAAGSHPGTGSSAKPLPDPLPTLRPATAARAGRPGDQLHGRCYGPLDAKRHRYARWLGARHVIN
jgi:hypothetical protein